MSKKSNNFYEDTVKGLQQAIEIEKGNVLLCEREGMSVPTYYVGEDTKQEIDKKNE